MAFVADACWSGSGACCAWQDACQGLDRSSLACHPGRTPSSRSPTSWQRQDRQACDALHSRIKGSVQEGIDFLLQARTGDPYAAATSRLLRESLHPGQPAPTFPL